MKLPVVAGARLDRIAWREVRRRAIFECCKWDIQSEDQCVLADFPIVVENGEWKWLAARAERAAKEAIEAERELAMRPELHERLGVPRAIRKPLRSISESGLTASAARVKRFDFHYTSEGWRISEANTDVPGGFIEASGFTQLVSDCFGEYLAPPSAAAAYAESIREAAGEGSVIALAHATAHSDDRQVMEYLAREIQVRGMRPMLVSPAHLRWTKRRAYFCGSALGKDPALLVRFFPGEWLPLLGRKELWTGWFCGETAMSNPGTALLTQSKRFPLVWQALRTEMVTWHMLLPETRDPRDVDTGRAYEWVYKPVWGRVGEDVVVSGVTAGEKQKQLMDEVRKYPEHWAAQKRFESVPIETHDGPQHFCLGVFTVDGRAAGIYGRISKRALIDQNAQDIAVLISRKEGCDADRQGVV